MNFRYILEQNNKDRLDGEGLSDSEFEQVKNQLQFSSFYKAGEWLVGENGKVMVHVQRDMEKLHLVVMNHEHIAGGSSVYEVINQYKALKSDDEDSTDVRDRRFDVTLMINGLPMIHIELKNKQHSYMDGFWQIKKYIGEGKFTGIFSAVQMFVVSNGVDTRYFAAAGDTELNPKFMSGWVDRKNNPVSDYLSFAKSVLRIPQAHEMIARYTVLDEDARRLILLRPYQIHAIESIREASKTGESGFVWHTTGSGKTLTSYKATRNLLMDIPSIDKTIFLIDRKDLDTQTTMAFQAYANNDLVDVDETDNVNDLKKKLKQYKDKIRFSYITPSYHNPTGIVMSPENRYKFYNLMKKNNIPIIEDGFNEELLYSSSHIFPICSLDNKNNGVIYIGSFSKILFPGMRIGWIFGDKNLIDRLVSVKRSINMHVSFLDQGILYDYLKNSNFDKYLKKINSWMRRRIRMIYWIRWKLVKTKYRNLQKFGINKRKALEWANTRKSY